MKYTIRVTMIKQRQVEIETTDDDNMTVERLVQLAREKARSEFGDADRINVGRIESGIYLVLL